MTMGTEPYDLDFTLDVTWPNGKDTFAPAYGGGPVATAHVSGVMTWDDPATVFNCDVNAEDTFYTVTGTLAARVNPGIGLEHTLDLWLGYIGQMEACTPTFFNVVWGDTLFSGEGTRWNHDEPNWFPSNISMACFQPELLP